MSLKARMKQGAAIVTVDQAMVLVASLTSKETKQYADKLLEEDKRRQRGEKVRPFNVGECLAVMAALSRVKP